MMLFDMGLMDLDVPVEKYLPEFASLRLGRVDENGDPLWTRPLEHKPTVRNLLNHTSLLDLGETFNRQERRMTPSDRASLERSVDFYSRLVLETERGLLIINCCSHGGVVNIIREVRETFPGRHVYGYIGGFHLFNKSDAEIRAVAQNIRATGLEFVCTGHCTGQRAYDILKQTLGDRLHQLHVGLEMTF